MRFFVISLFPEMFAPLEQVGITGRAIKNGQAVVECINPRDFTHDNYRRIDERPFGGGAGMVLMAEPVAMAIEFAKRRASEQGCQNCPVVYLSPQGQTLDEPWVGSAAAYDGMILLCGRYEGIDERLYRLIDVELSIGDYVLTGGELPAMVLMDSLIRRLPSVMNDASPLSDSFVDDLLDYPHYTKPLVFAGEAVPEVLLSGHHAHIAKWRFWQQLEQTQKKRPDLYQRFIDQSASLDKEHACWLEQFLTAQRATT